MTTPLRVFQVANGNLGTEMVKRIGEPTEKIGRDAGEIVGLPPIGVLAAGTVEEIIAPSRPQSHRRRRRRAARTLQDQILFTCRSKGLCQ
jgi:hypothetical protein